MRNVPTELENLSLKYTIVKLDLRYLLLNKTTCIKQGFIMMMTMNDKGRVILKFPQNFQQSRSDTEYCLNRNRKR